MSKISKEAKKISKDENNVYAKYKNITQGTDKIGADSFLFEELTNSTKSKYDNVIGWIKLK